MTTTTNLTTEANMGWWIELEVPKTTLVKLAKLAKVRVTFPPDGTWDCDERAVEKMSKVIAKLVREAKP